MLSRVLRTTILSAALLTVCSRSAEGRLFWQTYGATTPTADGCTWNANSDYFVPRHCDSGRYDLLSPCKTSRYTSPACRRLHPLYEGYCSPYAGWHYIHRDHLYARRCGCTPLAEQYGPWRLDRCKHGLCRHRLVLRDSINCRGEACLPADFAADSLCVAGGACLCNDLPNVEPMGVEKIGALPLALVGFSGGGMGSGMGMGAAGAGAGAAGMNNRMMTPMGIPAAPRPY
jgi:hypothetical protein